MNYEQYEDYDAFPPAAPAHPRRGIMLLMIAIAILFLFVVFGSIRTVRGWQDANRSAGAPADILVELKVDHLTRCEVGERVVVFQLAPGTYSIRCAAGR